MQEGKQTQRAEITGITGGGINTGETRQQEVVTQVLDIESISAPIREDELRARFLSFEPLFDADYQLVAHELILKGRMTVDEQNSKELAQMDEDMLLTGLFSLVQNGLTGELPLLVRISAGVLLSDIPEQINHPGLIWVIPVRGSALFERAQKLQQAGLNICLDMHSLSAGVLPRGADWSYLQFDVDTELPAVNPAARIIVENVCYADTLSHWPRESWFKGSLFTGETSQTDREFERRLELLAIAMRHPLETLMHFFKLNPQMEPRFVSIANSFAGGLSRPADSAAHALIMLGQQRTQRTAILAALAGAVTTDASRLYTKTAFTRALFMGKTIRLGAPAESAALAFQIGLLSTVPHVLALSTRELVRRLGLDPVVARALGGWATPENKLLKLAHACEENDTELLLLYSRELNIDMNDISAAYLEAVVAGEALEPALA